MLGTARIRKLIDDARASYWFVPSALVVMAIGLASASVAVDRAVQDWPMLARIAAVTTTAEGARAVVSVIAQSVLGVAGVMFSVTMVAVSFASGQFGPRLIGNFMRDRGNQWSLGILIASFTFALLILRAIQSPAEAGVDGFVPHLSVYLSLGMALLCVFVVIFHVHHIPETISVSNIVAGLGRRFVAEIRAAAGPVENITPTGASVDLTLKTEGYIHTVACEALSALAIRHGWQVSLLAAPGEFVHPRMAVLRVWDGDALTDDLRQALRQCIALGDTKTEDQNLLFIAEQLVEIVARAMSPGVNDPFTAVSCLEWMAAGLTVAAQTDDPLCQISASRLAPITLPFATVLDRSLGDCLPYVRNDALARRTFDRLLTRLAGEARSRHSPAVQALRDRLAAV